MMLGSAKMSITIAFLSYGIARLVRRVRSGSAKVAVPWVPPVNSATPGVDPWARRFDEIRDDES
jgi:hypothetical protein